jgi:hypothetical protein
VIGERGEARGAFAPICINLRSSAVGPSSLCAFASLREFFLRLPCAFLRLFRLGYRLSAIGYWLRASRLVSHPEHRVLHLIDQCARHRDGNIAE